VFAKLYALAGLAQWSFFYNGTHLYLQLGDEMFNVDVRECEKVWIEDANVRRVFGLGTFGIEAGRLRVEGVGEGYGLVAHTRSVLIHHVQRHQLHNRRAGPNALAVSPPALSPFPLASLCP